MSLSQIIHDKFKKRILKNVVKKCSLGDLVWQADDYVGFLTSEKRLARHWALHRCKELEITVGREMDDLLDDQDEFIRFSAIGLVGKRKLKEHTAKILEIYQNSSDRLAERCVLALGELECPETIPYFLDRLEARKSDTGEFWEFVQTLGRLNTEESLAFLHEMLSKFKFNRTHVTLIGYLYLAVFSHRNSNSNHIFWEKLAVDLKRIKNIGDREELLSLLVEHFINPDILYELQFIDEEGEGNWGAGIYRALGLTDLDHDSSQVINMIDEFMEKAAYADLIKAVNSLLPPTPSDKDEDITLDYRTGNRWLMETIMKTHNLPKKQPLDIQKLMAFAACAAYLSIQEHDRLPLNDDKDNLLNLFQREVGFRWAFEQELIDRLAALQDDFTGLCQQLIQDEAESAGRAVQLLRWQEPGRAIPILVNCLVDEKYDYMKLDIISVLKKIQHPQVIEDLAEVLYSGSPYGISGALDILGHYPREETVDLILQRFEKLWLDHSESLLSIINDIASPRFVQPLKEELKPGESEAERIYLLLCELHNIPDTDLEAMRGRYEQNTARMKAMVEKFYDPDSDFNPIAEKTIKLELKCKRCQRTYHYELNRVCVDLDNPMEGIYLGDQIKCKNCEAVDEYELTNLSRMSVMSYVEEIVKSKEGDYEDCPVKLIKMDIADGTKTTMPEAIKTYRERIEKVPGNSENYVRLGNIYNNLGRSSQAVEMYGQAVEINPQEAEALYNLMIIYESENRVEENEEMRLRLLELISSKSDIWRSVDRGKMIESLKSYLYSPEDYAHLEPVNVPRQTTKIGRNQPCPCCSGKKYKKCCGK